MLIIKKGLLSLDSILEGLPKSTSVVIYGELGTGKSTIARQILFEQLKKGDSGIYVTVDEPPREVRNHMKSFGWDIEKYEGKNFAVVDCYTWGVGATWMLEEIKNEEKYIVPSPAYPYQIIKVIKDAEKQIGKGALILDSFSGLFKITYSEPELLVRFGKNFLGERIGRPTIVTIDEKVIDHEKIEACTSVADVNIHLKSIPEGFTATISTMGHVFEWKYKITSEGIVLE